MPADSLFSGTDLDSSAKQSGPSLAGDMPLRTLVFSSQKGGSGKTTLCGQLAVQSEISGMGPIALIDTDPQGSLSDWWNARGEETPMFVKTTVDYLYETINVLRDKGVKLVFIDTQPTVTDTIKSIIRFGDLIVIPTRPSPHDLRAIGPTVDIVEECNKPMVFAINSANRRAKLTGDVAVALSQHGTVAPVTIHNRVDFATSMINGKSVMETTPDGKSAEEIRSLWEYIGERLRRLETDEGYQTFQTLDQEPEQAPDTEEPQDLQDPPITTDHHKILMPRKTDQQPTGFGRRNTKGFGRRKSDNFGIEPTDT